MPYYPRTIEERQELRNTYGADFFPQSYIDEVFNLWWQASKPGSTTFFNIVPPVQGTTVKPTINQLGGWINDVFKERAEKLDSEFMLAVQNNAVQLRVEMLQRHVLVAKEAQDIALRWLQEHQNEINANAAVRLLVEGIRIERDSLGISDALEKSVKMTDEELLSELENLIKSSPAKLEVLDG
jgi:hypothetical protein